MLTVELLIIFSYLLSISFCAEEIRVAFILADLSGKDDAGPVKSTGWRRLYSLRSGLTDIETQKFEQTIAFADSLRFLNSSGSRLSSAPIFVDVSCTMAMAFELQQLNVSTCTHSKWLPELGPNVVLGNLHSDFHFLSIFFCEELLEKFDFFFVFDYKTILLRPLSIASQLSSLADRVLVAQNSQRGPLHGFVFSAKHRERVVTSWASLILARKGQHERGELTAARIVATTFREAVESESLVLEAWDELGSARAPMQQCWHYLNCRVYQKATHTREIHLLQKCCGKHFEAIPRARAEQCEEQAAGNVAVVRKSAALHYGRSGVHSAARLIMVYPLNYTLSECVLSAFNRRFAARQVERRLRAPQLFLQHIPTEGERDFVRCSGINSVMKYFVQFSSFSNPNAQSLVKVATKLVNDTRKRLAEFASHLVVSSDENSRGLVIASGGIYFDLGLQSVHILRKTGFALPIEWYYADGSEMRPEWIRLLRTQYNVSVFNAAHEFRKRFNLEVGSLRGYHLEAACMVLTGLRHVIVIDSDVYALKNVEFLFDILVSRAGSCAILPSAADEYSPMKPHKDHAVIIWPDVNDLHGVSSILQPAMFQATGVERSAIVAEIDSGIAFIDRFRAKNAITMNFFLNMARDLFYFFDRGDRNTLYFSAIMTDTAHFLPHTPAVAVKRVQDGRICGVGRLVKTPGNESDYVFYHDGFLKYDNDAFANMPILMSKSYSLQRGDPKLNPRCWNLNASLTTVEDAPHWLQETEAEFFHLRSTFSHSIMMKNISSSLLDYTSGI